MLRSGMMEKPPELGEKQSLRANSASSGPIVIDLLEDTPRPISRFLKHKTNAGMNAEIVLSDGSDDVFEVEEGVAQKLSKRGKMEPARTARDDSKPRTTICLDPFTLTSPIEPAFPSRARRASETPASFNDDLDDLTFLSDRTNLPQLRGNTGPQLSDRTAVLLAALRDTSPHGQSENLGPCHSSKADVGSTSENCAGRRGGIERESCPSFIDILATPPKKARRKRLTSAERQERAKEKESARLAREASRKTEKENKQMLKELRAREKETAWELAFANRLKIDKKISTPEMIVDLPYSLEGSPLGDQIQSLLKNIQVEVVFAGTFPIPNVVSWRRKVVARYNKDLGHWEPIQEQIRDEKHVMCLVSANDFVEMAQAGPDDPVRLDIDAHVLRLKSGFESCSLIYLVEGLGAWMRKNNNVKNRAFQAAVLYQGRENTDLNDSQGNGSRRKRSAQRYVDADMIEDALLKLQVVHKCLVHHTASAVETAEWVSNFTQHISTIPYRNQRMDLETSFCMEAGQVKTGENSSDTYIKMLQEITRVTGPVAYGIAAEYPDVLSLMSAFKSHGPTALQDLKKSANKNGAFTNNNIGQAISKRVYRIFMGTDPASNDV
ncbi:hypothetical protein GP486_000035 [Trichoglossum hirsutum]|uniref:ERCC4 domain-containing protein n=1 Tax=Trichoglossum hirsutum TaxID=265104 RepID=A0A9P8LJP5_9PEZI|nr:hypothetical protein GP486_000035 [Trichoglossum hirsutum]